MIRSLCAALLLSLGCGGVQGREPPVRPLFFAAPRVERFTSNQRGFLTNSYVVDGGSDVLVIDTQFTTTEARHLLDAVRMSYPSRHSTAVVLHPNPDKFNGTKTFQDAGFDVITSNQVLAAIPAVYAQRTRAFLSRYPNDWPMQEPKPRGFGATTTVIQLGTEAFTLHVLGKGCSAAHVVVQYGDDVFVGDLIASGTHAWLELGYINEWLDALTYIEQLRPLRVHPGRGLDGGPELINKQREYLLFVRDLVDREPNSHPTKEPLAVLADRIAQAYPSLHYRIFMEQGLRRLIQNRHRGTTEAGE